MARKARGEGTSAYQVGENKWRAEVRVNGERKVVYGQTEALANRKLRQAVTDAENGILIPGKSPTLGEWLDHWVENIAPGKTRPQTLVGYRSKIRLYVRGTRVEKVRLNNLMPEHLEVLYKPLRDKGLSETTVLQLHRIISRALKVAVQHGKLAVNPATRIDAPTAAKFKPDLLSVEDARSLIRLAKDMDGGARWILALSLGIRQGEALGMGWDQVDLDAGTLEISRELVRLPHAHGCKDPVKCTRGKHHVPEGCGHPMHRGGCPRLCEPGCVKHASSCPQRIGGGQHISKPKSDAGSRVIHLPGPVLDALKAHREQQDEILAEDGRERPDVWTSANGESVDLVFCQRNGKPIGSRADWGNWKAFLAAAGVPEVRVHDARHTAATVLLLMGVPERVVMDMLGWSQQSMLKRYQHVVAEMKIAAADAVTAALFTEPQKLSPEPEPQEEQKIVSMDEFRRRRGA